MEYRACHILVKDRSLAERLLKQAKSGARFETLAKDFSTCPSKSTGGDLGWFGPGKMVPEFERACAKLSPGRLSGIVRTQFGYHLIKLTGRR
ncbi:MAG: peptidylprolyl isomerase [Salinispira sp.]